MSRSTHWRERPKDTGDDSLCNVRCLRVEIVRLNAEMDIWRDSNTRMRAEMENQAKRANDAEWDAAELTVALKKILRLYELACENPKRNSRAREAIDSARATLIRTKPDAA